VANEMPSVAVRGASGTAGPLPHGPPPGRQRRGGTGRAGRRKRVPAPPTLSRVSVTGVGGAGPRRVPGTVRNVPARPRPRGGRRSRGPPPPVWLPARVLGRRRDGRQTRRRRRGGDVPDHRPGRRPRWWPDPGVLPDAAVDCRPYRAAGRRIGRPARRGSGRGPVGESVLRGPWFVESVV
jgi:hypothetical protein